MPIAKQMPDGRLAYIVTDHLGTPREMFDEAGGLRWAASLTTWGVVRREITPPEPANDEGHTAIYPRGSTQGNLALKLEPDQVAYECPIRFQGQWADRETELSYNRHRHYDPLAAQYASPDPVGLAGGDRPQGYVGNPKVSADPLGLNSIAAAPGSGSGFGSRIPYENLNPAIRRLDAKLPEQGSMATFSKDEVSMRQLKTLTGHTGDEYSMYTQGSRRIVIRGYGRELIVDPAVKKKIKQGEFGKWSGHTHPPGYGTSPSIIDRDQLGWSGQSRSGIWGDGGTTRFRQFPMDDNR